ncbi:MAG: O-antigen ligase [Dysgonamonadaceae bacterium]|nr:O-antigen ligase [Dysgonamonadaceae bacterium]
MKIIIRSLIIISFVVLVYLAFGTYDTGFDYLYLLPFSVLVLSLIFRKQLMQYKGSFVATLLLIQVGIRYLAIPLYNSFSDNTDIVFTNVYHFEVVFFMILELIAIYSVLAYYSNKQLNALKIKQDKIKTITPSLSLILILSVVFIYIFLSGFFLRVNYIWQIKSFIEMSEQIDKIPALAGVLFNPFRIIASLLLISFIYNKPIKNVFKVLFLFAILIFNSIIIVETSRISIILIILPLAFIFYTVFNDLKKHILIGMGFILISVIAITTIGKFSRTIERSESFSIINEKSLNAYFAGPMNINTALNLYYDRDEWDRMDFMMNDFFQNVPMLSRLTEDDFKTNVLFNEQIYGHRVFQDQIVPLSLNGLIHFGVIGPLLYPLLFITLALFFERRYLQRKFIGDKFVNIYLAIVFSLIFMLNIGFIFATFLITLVFIVIPFKVIKFFNRSDL